MIFMDQLHRGLVNLSASVLESARYLSDTYQVGILDFNGRENLAEIYESSNKVENNLVYLRFDYKASPFKAIHSLRFKNGFSAAFDIIRQTMENPEYILLFTHSPDPIKSFIKKNFQDSKLLLAKMFSDDLAPHPFILNQKSSVYHTSNIRIESAHHFPLSLPVSVDYFNNETHDPETPPLLLIFDKKIYHQWKALISNSTNKTLNYNKVTESKELKQEDVVRIQKTNNIVLLGEYYPHLSFIFHLIGAGKKVVLISSILVDSNLNQEQFIQLEAIPGLDKKIHDFFQQHEHENIDLREEVEADFSPKTQAFRYKKILESIQDNGNKI